ncbi:hypothetical protein [Clostridium thermarum]|uniref:hypothetical protein n=1 Tax=Clostridium thermarum TaxID=1716543 RepID=UPI00112178EE|nr:hypothetical protein [Clostridium thermarum]
MFGNYYGGGYGGSSNCICDFPTLVILILIVLQFSKRNKEHHDDDDYEYDGKFKNDQIGNGVLFIIALFFLSCAGCGRR